MAEICSNSTCKPWIDLQFALLHVFLRRTVISHVGCHYDQSTKIPVFQPPNLRKILEKSSAYLRICRRIIRANFRVAMAIPIPSIMSHSIALTDSRRSKSRLIHPIAHGRGKLASHDVVVGYRLGLGTYPDRVSEWRDQRWIHADLSKNLAR